jgi:hypothetical protein
MTDYTSQIDAWYNAIQYRNPPASELATFNAQLQSGVITTAQAIQQIEASPYTQNFVDPVIREYQAAFGRVPDQAGVAYWVGQVAANPSNLTVLSTIFANSAEFNSLYGASATTPANSTLVAALYQNVLGRPADAAGLAYWSNQPLDAAQLLQAFAQSAEYVTDTTPYITTYQNLEVAGTEPTTGSLYSIAVQGGVTTYNIGLGVPINFTITGVLGGQPITGTVSGGPAALITGTNNVVIEALTGLNNFQNIVLSGTNNVLNANYSPVPASNYLQTGLNLVNIQTWNINISGPYAGESYGVVPPVVSFSGDAAVGNVIKNLTTVNLNDNSGTGTLLIGDNSEPVQETNGANGFTITAANAVGYNSLNFGGGPVTVINGVEVDIAAQAFTGKDTLNVTANIVGGFGQLNGSYVIPPPVIVAQNDGDNYNPNWLGYQRDAFSIVSGASGSSLTTLNGVTLPPTGAVGFQTWDIASIGAKSVGTVNILALGNEGSWNATTINLTDDGSTTLLFASALQDSLSTDWQNISTINLAGTSGYVVISGAETDAQAAAAGYTFGGEGGGGLLTSDTSALVTITGGAGNSFYDLSSLSLAAATNANALFDGGHGTHGNSEIAFSNYVVANATPTSLGLAVNISHIQVLDDTGGLVVNGVATNLQGGVIDMADFSGNGGSITGLQPLNTAYDLIQGAPLSGNFVSPLNPTGAGLAVGTAAPNDIVPAGYQLLQLLDADGSTANTLGAALTIRDGFTQFAINAGDLADGTLAFTQSGPVWTGWNITIEGENVVPNVNTTDHLKLWVSDDGITNLFGNGAGTALYVPDLTIANYTTVDIYLPYESLNPAPNVQDYVVLGGATPAGAPGTYGFNDVPVITANATVNFYDNTGDTGGSLPGPDDLVLGYTSFTGALVTANIGTDTVNVDGFTSTTGTTINDFGKGTLEIGATDAAFLNAQSTSHLIMDLPASTDWFALNQITGASGINVNGSSTGQNLLQGSSGVTVLDNSPAQGHGNYVLELAPNQVVGNDTLTGGADSRTDYVANASYRNGNGGDNFFPEGGVDTVNIGLNLDSHGNNIAGTSVQTDSTVWVGVYDVGNSGAANFGAFGSAGGADWGVAPLAGAPGTQGLYGQAITDIVGGNETYVDGYGGKNIVNVNNFHVSGVASTGDTINLYAADWAVGNLTTGHDFGLVTNFGANIPSGAGTAHGAVLNLVNQPGVVIPFAADVTADGIGNYANAQYLQQALTSLNTGDLLFGLPGGFTNGSIEHVLIAYNSGSSVNIADVTIQNTSGHILGGIIDTASHNVTVTATDLVHITGAATNNDVNIGNLTSHNIFFV